MKNAVFWNVSSCDSCKNRRLGGTYRLYQLLVTANLVPSSLIVFALMMEAIRWFLQESHGVTSQKSALFKYHRLVRIFKIY
jgi:hypothetical protein